MEYLEYEIAIPTLGRTKILCEQTLHTLDTHKIDHKHIAVFVVADEYDAYRLVVSDDIKIVIGVPTLDAQRKFINTYYPEGTKLICLDDDIKEIDLSMSAFTTLDSFFISAFDDLVKFKSFIWGVYPTFNAFFRKSRPDMTTSLAFIIGTMFGVIVRHDADLLNTLTTGTKEDTERTLRYFKKDGCVLRYDKIAFKTKFFNSVGGLGNLESRMVRDKAECAILESNFKAYGSIRSRKDGRAEFKLNKIQRRDDGVTLLEAMKPESLDLLYNMLSKISIIFHRNIKTDKYYRVTRRGFPEHRSATFGIVKLRVIKAGDDRIQMSAISKKHPLIHDEIFRLGKLICPFDFISVHLNHNTECPPHFDSENAGKSVLLSFGDYEGGKIIVEGVEYNARYQPLMFNGTNNLHYNTPIESGNKYSLVFFNTKIV